MEKYSRKDFLKKGLIAGAAFAGAGTLLSYCRKPADEGGADEAASQSCNDTSGLAENEITARNDANYVESSKTPGQTCSNCNYYTQPTGGAYCGGCQLLKGPFNPIGHCDLWAAKA